MTPDSQLKVGFQKQPTPAYVSSLSWQKPSCLLGEQQAQLLQTLPQHTVVYMGTRQKENKAK